MISNRAQLLKPSPTLAMANRARELQASGKDVISLTVGEPDWPTLPSASKAGIQAIEAGYTKYTAASGSPELRKALRPWILEETGIDYSEAEIAVGSGAKFVIAAILQMTVDPGDEVLIPSPYWVSYPVMAELAGGVARIIECGEADNFKLTPELLRRAVTPKSKVLILCAPSNPTGISYSESELKALAKVLKEFPNLLVISDDIYNRLMLDGTLIAPHLLKVAPELRDRTLVVNGASKAFSMTGWRIGWVAGPLNILKPLADYFSQTTSNPASISQKATLAALLHGKGEIAAAVVELRKRHVSGQRALETVPGLKIVPSQGAFYFWVDVRAWFGKTDANGQRLGGSKDIAEALLDQALLATIPGAEFGAEGYLRLSFAIAEPRMTEAASRMKKFAESLK
jgi:aspartate aminotransferase